MKQFALAQVSNIQLYLQLEVSVSHIPWEWIIFNFPLWVSSNGYLEGVSIVDLQRD